MFCFKSLLQFCMTSPSPSPSQPAQATALCRNITHAEHGTSCMQRWRHLGCAGMEEAGLKAR